MSFNLGLSLTKDPRSVKKPLVVKFDVYEYVQLTVQLEGSGQEWRLELEPGLTKCHPEGLLLHCCISEAFELTKPHLEIDPLCSLIPDTSLSWPLSKH